MTDKELADKAVGLLPDFYDWGDRPGQASERYGTSKWHLPKIAHDFVRDWRVAGALMEKYSVFRAGKETHYCIALPMEARAIIEACLETLTDDPTT